jgi:hypothetical protein
VGEHLESVGVRPARARQRDQRSTGIVLAALGELELSAILAKPLEHVIKAVVSTTARTGAGFLTDQTLREFLKEYNGRLWLKGPNSLPSYWVFARAFFAYEHEDVWFRLLPEKDYVFSFSDFIDFATLEGSGLDAYAAAMDFLLKNERTVVETKMTRDGLGARQVGDELLIDIGRYRAHQDCSTLVCFVYDPLGIIGNPASLEADLSRDHGGLRVRVWVMPKQ